MDAPVQPNGHGGHDEGIAIEEKGALGGHAAREVLQQELVFLGEGLLVGGHGCPSGVGLPAAVRPSCLRRTTSPGGVGSVGVGG